MSDLNNASTSRDRVAEQLISDPNNSTLANEFVKLLVDEMGIFDAEEDTLYDYKREFPHSPTDAYFAAIVRLSLAFFNTFGGIIVLGVHDRDRTGGHNKTMVNLEKFNRRLRELTGTTVNVRLQRCGEGNGKVDLLVVPKRQIDCPPARLLNSLDKFEIGTTWLRRGHEVLEAESRDIPFLFSPRDIVHGPDIAKVASYLPPPISTIEKFVGRIDLLSKLLDWLVSDEEPRIFLWGRGGSGKSTVAYEFAAMVRNNGRKIPASGGGFFDRVIYLSAKERELNTLVGEVQATKYTDFGNLRELLIGILVAADYSTTEDFGSLNLTGLSTRVSDLFDHENMLVVIDDIDTLTTKGEDAGFDLLYKLAIKSRGTIRVLYTQRNLPVSAESALQVPGFDRDADYEEFVVNCCEQFRVPLPDAKYLNGDLRTSTESIPLIVETILRLRRSCGTYEKAHSIFLERKGEEARRYLFEREYESLPKDNNARHILAAIAEFTGPVGNAEVRAVVRIAEDEIAESIGQVLGFFLSTSLSHDGETRYFLNPVTRIFIKEKSRQLNFGPLIVERVRAFRSAGMSRPKEVVIIEGDVERLMGREDWESAFQIFARDYPAQVTESPSFRMLRAIVMSRQTKPMLTEARDDFQYCSDQKFEHADGMRVWFNLERLHGQSYVNQVRICDLVIGGKTYADTIKHEFYQKRGMANYYWARESAPADAFELFGKSLRDHVRAHCFFSRTGHDTNFSFKYARNTGISLVGCARILGLDKEVISIFKDIHSLDGFLCDPLFDGLVEFARFLSSGISESARRREGIGRTLLGDMRKGVFRLESPQLTTRAIDLLSTQFG